jgi:hypothetical protein
MYFSIRFREDVDVPIRDAISHDDNSVLLTALTIEISSASQRHLASFTVDEAVSMPIFLHP